MGEGRAVTVNGGDTIADNGDNDVTSIKIEGDDTTLDMDFVKEFVWGRSG